ncbi:MAG: ubiquitin-like domain-containing protein, partial [Kiritimatiellia bacterium]
MAGSSVEFALEASLGQERRVLVAKRIGLFFVMMSIMVALQSLTLKEVNILVRGEQMRTVHTAATRVGVVLSRVGIQLNEGDVVEPAASTRLESGATINITRAFPVQIKVDGQLMQVRLTEGSII